MVSTEYKKAVVEVLEIISRMEEEEVKKIPREVIEFYEANKLDGYKPNINYEYNIENVELMPKTREILAGLYVNYFCNEKERKEYLENIRKNLIEYEEKKREEYKATEKDLFRNEIEENKKNEQENKALINYEEIPWYKKIFNKIKNMYK